MQKNDLLRYEDTIIRVLELVENSAFVIDCKKTAMPYFLPSNLLQDAEVVSLPELYAETNRIMVNWDDLSEERKSVAYEKFSWISCVIPFLLNKNKRAEAIQFSAAMYQVSERTIRNYLISFLIYQDKTTLLPPVRAIKEDKKQELSPDQKKMRWALNKYFYSSRAFTLPETYIQLLKEKYCDENGELPSTYPTFFQFRYFYRKTKNLQKFYISREGIKEYQKNHRPLLGDGVQTFAKTLGFGMLDSTIADIFLINDEGELIGRPIITACIDAYSYYCCGFTLTLEGGIYSLSELMKQVAGDKVGYCKEFGILINEDEWFSGYIPGVLITDKGTEYKSDTFSQITELGSITLVNLDAYRPDLKSVVEKFFDIIQGLFKSQLKGKGVIMPDYQERGAPDYRKEACLTLRQFEAILIHCILFYNNKWLIEEYPCPEEMIDEDVAPIPKFIWRWEVEHHYPNLIAVTEKQLHMTLLPRTEGKFKRRGLIVTKLRYANEKYKEMYLKGGTVTVAYDPDDVSVVWLIENGRYVPFDLIESRYQGKNMDETEKMRSDQKSIVNQYEEAEIKGKIDLVCKIEAIAGTASKGPVNVKSIRSARIKERYRQRNRRKELS